LVYFFRWHGAVCVFPEIAPARARWLIGVTAIYLCMGVLLMILLNAA